MKKNCIICKKEIEIQPCRMNRIKTCSVVCRKKNLSKKHMGIGIKRIKSNCKICKKEFNIQPSRKNKIVCCSKNCRITLRTIIARERFKKTKKLSKTQHWNWKGGITPFNKNQRLLFQRTIAKEVLKRDNYTCQNCGSNSDLQVDHIQPWAEYVELRFNINNCRTLCSKCHYKITFGKPMSPKIRTWGKNLKGGIYL